MCARAAEHDRLIRTRRGRRRQRVVLFGARTGRDGIGGASVLASAELGDGDADKRPTVQIGDPFEEKKLLECSLELLDRGLLVSLQDLGAAGLTSSSAEMASKGGVGLDLDVGRVPLREPDMEPFEIMVSESQERMLCVVEPERGRRGARGLRELGGRRRPRSARSPTPAACACSTAASSSATCRSSALVDDCPLYDLEPAQPARRSTRRRRARSPPSDARRAAAGAAGLAPTSPRAGRCSSSTTRSCGRARCAGRRRPTRRCCTLARRRARSPSRSTATAGASPATRTAAPSRRCSSARRTSPASAPSRSG